MAKNEKVYITTAIDYVNAAPHIGHAYQKIIADVLARWNKLQGKGVLFVTGTDEHGKKVQESAEKAGKKPKEFVDGIVTSFKESWKALNIDYDRFIRTTDKDHAKIVKEFIKKCEENGDIYKGNYSGLYCVGCEQYYTDKEFENNICPHHNRPLEKVEEESYFFKLSNYSKKLLKLYKDHPEFIQPKSRRNEIINRVKEGLRDLSITRTSFDWGIPFPLDKKHVTYVWFDALINYYTATREKKREDFWGKPTIHLLGKDNTWFHTVYWPAMLMSAGIELPKTTFNHGFLTFNGQKISKSLGNAISPQILVEKYGADSIRYFVCRHFPFASGNDGDFDEKALVDRHNNELANKLGNLVSRVSGLIEQNGMEKLSKDDDQSFINESIEMDKLVIGVFDNFQIDRALNFIFEKIDHCNEYIQLMKPWETKNGKVLYEVANMIKSITILLSPFMPETCEKIAKQFGFKISHEELNKPLDDKTKIKKGKHLFTRIEYKVDEKVNKVDSPKEIMDGVTTIEYTDFEKIDLRVGEIENVEDIEGADKLYKLTVSLGEETRTICAGIKNYYSHEDLKGLKIVVLSNLKPRKLKGILSEGMLLAAANKDESKVVLIGPTTQDIEVGSRVM